jgi:hypothetical protein
MQLKWLRICCWIGAVLSAGCTSAEHGADAGLVTGSISSPKAAPSSNLGAQGNAGNGAATMPSLEAIIAGNEARVAQRCKSDAAQQQQSTIKKLEHERCRLMLSRQDL